MQISKRFILLTSLSSLNKNMGRNYMIDGQFLTKNRLLFASLKYTACFGGFIVTIILVVREDDALRCRRKVLKPSGHKVNLKRFLFAYVQMNISK